MSRKHARARKRTARLEALRDEAEAARDRGPEALWALLTQRAHSDALVWDVARAIDCDDDEKAMIMQSIDKRLAGMTPGAVLFRHRTAERETGKPYKDPPAGCAGQAPQKNKENANARS